MSALTGVERIAAERERQVQVEGFTAQHDALYGTELLRAAACYLEVARATQLGASWQRLISPEWAASSWPWPKEWWKPSTDPVRNLEKVGALIAAEIDRLQCLQSGGAS